MTRAAERRLIERAARGDKAAASRLIKAHQGSLYSYMLRMSGRPDVAEDITQDAFVRVLMHIDRFDDRYRFSTWLFTIAKRLYVNACQKHKPRYDSDIVGGAGGDHERPYAPAADDEIQVRRRDVIQSALTVLTETQREVVLLFHQQDWPIALIAQHCSMPEGTVKSHLHRARLKMRKHIAEQARDGRVAEEALL